ncbi:ran-binding protein 9 isoform X1 [Daktulosphaira vitifoliae]|uniref:ran-binding protein 9 isoform X1 n=1 Tax=Daktulosphaira vitifoliae TaxID=58002 RepID=UPI0021AAAF20|nr:ran-binding protein 9 isoform X1 [Daktulosphaira vitifoliae]
MATSPPNTSNTVVVSPDCSGAKTSSSHFGKQGEERLKNLYPMVDENDTPLPRSWNSKDKFTNLGLSQNNIRVHYKGHGKTHKDAASVRATHPIPASCGLYYFEVKIVSKGRDGYMGVGLSAQGVNMNRLPGWDKHSYGYHGDDGHSFCSSGTGQPYGPTFTTGDVIGCGVDLVHNKCFYTKNGTHLGTAFTDLPPNLFPTVGLQTPGEVVDANFGQWPFVFKIEEMMKELRNQTQTTIQSYPFSYPYSQCQTNFHKMVSTYLVHQGFCATAEAFISQTDQSFEEEITSIKNRQKILKLVSTGRMGEAIEMTNKLYPGLLESNRNLLFKLKCRQFVEMVNGTDSEVAPYSHENIEVQTTNRPSPKRTLPSNRSPTSIQTNGSIKCQKLSNSLTSEINEMNSVNLILNGSSDATTIKTIKNGNSKLNDYSIEKMDCNEDSQTTDYIMTSESINGHHNNHYPDGDYSSNGYHNGHSCENLSNGNSRIISNNGNEESMEIDQPEFHQPTKKVCGGSKPGVEKMLEFGRELFLLSLQLRQELGRNETNKKMLQDAFSLLAYSNPWNSPVGWQLESSQRDSVCAALNSAILESSNLPRRPPLEMTVGHAYELVKLMAASSMGACAFTNIDELLK